MKNDGGGELSRSVMLLILKKKKKIISNFSAGGGYRVWHFFDVHFHVPGSNKTVYLMIWIWKAMKQWNNSQTIFWFIHSYANEHASNSQWHFSRINPFNKSMLNNFRHYKMAMRQRFAIQFAKFYSELSWAIVEGVVSSMMVDSRPSQVSFGADLVFEHGMLSVWAAT